MRKRGYWAWSTHPYDERVDALRGGGFGWWTCHPDTKQGDLILVYLTGGEIAFLVEAASTAQFIERGEWAGGFACDFISHAEFANPLTLRSMKADKRLVTDFSALRGNFQQRAYAIDPDVWDHLLGRLVRDNPSAEKKVREALRRRVAEDVLREHEIRDRLEVNLDVLRPKWKLRLVGKEYWCDGLGFIDLLTRDRRGPVVIELKRGKATADAVSQTMAYMGWIEQNAPEFGPLVRGIVVSDGYHQKFRYALEPVPNLHHVELDTIRGPLGL